MLTLYKRLKDDDRYVFDEYNSKKVKTIETKICTWFIVVKGYLFVRKRYNPVIIDGLTVLLKEMIKKAENWKCRKCRTCQNCEIIFWWLDCTWTILSYFLRTIQRLLRRSFRIVQIFDARNQNVFDNVTNGSYPYIVFGLLHYLKTL